MFSENFPLYHGAQWLEYQVGELSQLAGPFWNFTPHAPWVGTSAQHHMSGVCGDNDDEHELYMQLEVGLDPQPSLD